MNREDKKSSSFSWSQSSRLLVTIIIIIQLILIITGLLIRPTLGLVMLTLGGVSYIIILQLKKEYLAEIEDYVQHLSTRVKKGEEESLIKMPIGIILYDEENDDQIEWLNPFMMAQISEKNIVGKNLDKQAPVLVEKLQKNKDKNNFHIHYNDKTFQVIREKDQQILYFLDITQRYNIEQKYLNSRPVIGFLLLDNYDELTRLMDDREVLKFDTMLTTYFSNWFKQRNIYYKKIDDDRYLLVTNREELANMEEDKFSIIDNIRERTSKRGSPLTISLGLSYSDNNDYHEMAEAAESNVELALARGGDQAIVNKVGEDPQFYGGKSDPMVKRTRVRARMVTQALESLINQSDTVFVMGHKQSDLDSVGSSLGVRRIAELNQKEAFIVIDQDELNNDVRYIINESLKNEQIGPYIISPKEAVRKANENSLVIMVDHHRTSLSLAPELIGISKRLVIIDHHRRGNEFPEDPTLVYIEPYASSASELVTEMFEYASNEGVPINALEATALLGGIVVDSNNFSLRTGSRTFNAASFLQSVGADNKIIRDILSEKPEIYIERSRLIEKMEEVIEGIYVASGNEEKVYNPIIAAQTADTMLTLTGVEASFVITKRPDKLVGISARSSGRINVQVIMEKMGGGGHLSNAATQLKDVSIEEAKEQLVETIYEILGE